MNESRGQLDISPSISWDLVFYIKYMAQWRQKTSTFMLIWSPYFKIFYVRVNFLYSYSFSFASLTGKAFIYSIIEINFWFILRKNPEGVLLCKDAHKRVHFQERKMKFIWFRKFRNPQQNFLIFFRILQVFYKLQTFEKNLRKWFNLRYFCSFMLALGNVTSVLLPLKLNSG